MKLAKNLENLGTESAFSVLAEAKALEAKGNPMIHLGLGQPDFKTPKHVVEAAKKALDDGHHGYVMSNGIPECRQAVTRWIKKRYSVDVDFERILIMPGGKPTMSYAIQCFGEPGAEIIHPTPAFPIYESMINYTGSTSVPYDLTEDKDLKFNPEKILSLITDKTRLLVLINPNNPTGSVAGASDLNRLLAILEKWPNCILIADEIYDGLDFSGRQVSAASLSDTVPVLSMNGVSKVYYAPGWRIGYMAIHDPISSLVAVRDGIERILRSRLCASTPAQLGYLAGLEQDRSWMKQYCETVKERRDVCLSRISEIEGLEVQNPEGAFYMFVKLTDQKWAEDDKSFVLQLLHEEHVLVVHGSGFSSEKGKGHFRLVFLPDIDTLHTAFDRIESFLQKHRIT